MEAIEERIRSRVAEIPGVSVLVVFGSRAREESGLVNDLDIGVLPSFDGADDGSFSRHLLQKQLAVALADLAPEGRVDVVFLDEAPDTLRQRVMEHGRVVLCRDPEAWRALRVRTMREYGDREWARRLFRRELRRRLLEGRSSDRSARAREPLERARRVSGQAREL